MKLPDDPDEAIRVFQRDMAARDRVETLISLKEDQLYRALPPVTHGQASLHSTGFLPIPQSAAPGYDDDGAAVLPPVPCCLYPWLSTQADDGTSPVKKSDLPTTLSLVYRLPSDGFGSAFHTNVLTLDAESATILYTGESAVGPVRLYVGTYDRIDYLYYDWNLEQDFNPDGSYYRDPYFFSPLIAGEQACLIHSYSPTGDFNSGSVPLLEVSVTDNFLDTYTVGGVDTITRTGTCTWTGPRTGGRMWTVTYGTVAYKWTLNGVAKSDPQNGPAGTYGGVAVS